MICQNPTNFIATSVSYISVIRIGNQQQQQQQQRTTEELVPIDAQVPIGASNSRIIPDAYHKEPLLRLAIEALKH
ncbi:hypothetical protein Tco_1537693 [Tanacetum coccineum]